MPPTLSYPGVYVEEIPSGVRTIVGVATSIAAFVGRAERGPTDNSLDKATTINGFGDFERIFGGLWEYSSLGYAVRDFFLNGGAQAVIVRLYKADPGNPTAVPPVLPPNTKAQLTVGAITLEAANEGKWGGNLRVALDQQNISSDVAQSMGLTTADLFNLTVREDVDGGSTEQYLNLTLKPGPRRIDNVLKDQSALIRWAGNYPSSPPAMPTAFPVYDSVSSAANDWTAKQKVVQDQIIAGQTPAATDVTAAAAAKTAYIAAQKAALDAVSDGQYLSLAEFLPANGQTNKVGLYALESVDLFNILCIPPYRDPSQQLDVDVALVSVAATYCENRRAMLIVDSPKDWTSKDTARSKFNDNTNDYIGTRSRNAALFFPRIKETNPLHDNQMEDFAPCGVVAGLFARTDTQRGVWKAPAGLDATVVGVPQLSVPLTDAENGELNPLGINCLRSLPAVGRVLWGSRTLRGADRLADEWKYIPVRRTALFIEESLYRGTQWVVFEPNDEPLWAQIRLNVGAFMHNLFRQGAFQGKTPRDAYFVKCDNETTTQNDIDLGIVNIVVGFAPLKPAEFVIIKLQQIAGQIET